MLKAMITTFELEANQLDASFVRAVKNLFKNRRVRVTIEPEIDETEYLLNHAASREQLLKNMKEVGNEEIVTFSLDQFNELSDSLLKNRI